MNADGPDNAFVGGIGAAVIGGTVSSISGGSFANGAFTAAFSYALGSVRGGGKSDRVDRQTAAKKISPADFDKMVKAARRPKTLEKAKEHARKRIDSYCNSGADCSEINVAEFNKVNFFFSKHDFDPSPVQGTMGATTAANDTATVGQVELFPGGLALAGKSLPEAMASTLIHEFIHETPANIALSNAYWSSGQQLDWGKRPQEIHATQLEPTIK
jgi:hypothetical protein